MRLAALLLLAPTAACATVRGGGSQDDAEHQVELFCRALHWKDFEAASLLFVPEVRGDWRRARDAAHDDRDLSITACDLRDLKLNSTSTGARAFVKMSWFRLPNSVEQSGEVEQRWEWRSGKWYLMRELGGPLEAAKP
ncbi:MAG TPA: hypothetical protein VMB50_05675 [Myxococcales bacterium]|nr:hypothetical protein [Myxococcales bacterium]